jgi:acyl-CoA synthetase (AMP-forming)/AMP-acid ligase II
MTHSILKVQPDNKDEPERCPHTQLCSISPTYEPGLVVAVVNEKVATARFDGYSDTTASHKKILKDVFKKGDSFFNSGDLLSRDAFGFFYWSDRVGDTFRWKGENVATSEVEHVLTGVSDIVKDVVVYGVEVPKSDGKIGMAALQLQGNVTITNIDWTPIHVAMQKNLPSYARPAFFRIQQELKMTSTFKHQKNDLIKEGFDPKKVNNEPLFFYSVKDATFTKLDDKVYSDICDGSIKF